ncbi:MAG: heterodisulfide reductase, partial [Thiohalomonadales bacterium]
MVPKNQQTAKFAQIFWDNLVKTGRVNELTLTIKIYFMNGIVGGIKTGMAMAMCGLGLMKTKRLSPMELFGGHKCKGAGDIKKILKKAAEIEAAKIKSVDSI